MTKEKKISLIQEWNERCGKKAPRRFGNPNRKSILLNQVERIREELDEVVEAINNKDEMNLLKELADVRVTTEGLDFLSKLPVDEAFQMVIEDNDLKFTESHDEVCKALLSMCYGLNEHTVVSSQMQGTTFFSIHRLKDDKICKLQKHEELDFSNLIGGK